MVEIVMLPIVGVGIVIQLGIWVYAVWNLVGYIRAKRLRRKEAVVWNIPSALFACLITTDPTLERNHNV